MATDYIRVGIEVAIIILALAVMIVVILNTNKLIGILSGSKVEQPWRQARLLQMILIVIFFFFATVRVIATIGKANGSLGPGDFVYELGIGANHNFIMNASFLLTALLLVLTVRVDLKAYNGLFKLLKAE